MKSKLRPEIKNTQYKTKSDLKAWKKICGPVYAFNHLAKLGDELIACEIDCIYLIFLEVFDVSCFNIGGSIETPLDTPEGWRTSDSR